MTVITPLRQFTVAEYHRMSELGIFRPGERTELLNGQIITMAAKGTAHSSAMSRTRRILELNLGDRAIIRVQDPIELDDHSEPEPDIAILKQDPWEYATHHPQSSDVYLLIEIADSSFAYDREVKAIAYATSAILEYWLLDVQNRKLHVFRQPNPQGYQHEMILAETLDIAPLAFPTCRVTVQDLLPLLVRNES